MKITENLWGVEGTQNRISWLTIGANAERSLFFWHREAIKFSKELAGHLPKCKLRPVRVRVTYEWDAKKGAKP